MQLLAESLFMLRVHLMLEQYIQQFESLREMIIFELLNARISCCKESLYWVERAKQNAMIDR